MGKNCQPVGYIIVIILVAILVFYGGYALWFSGLIRDPIVERVVTLKVSQTQSVAKNDKQVYLTEGQFNELSDILAEIKENGNNLHENHLTISTLNGFYASLFTAIAIIIAAIGYLNWKVINDRVDKLNSQIYIQIKEFKSLMDKHALEIEKQNIKMVKLLEEYDKYKERVNFLYERKKLADWAEAESYNYELDSIEEKDKFRKVKKYLADEHKDYTHLEIIIAQQMVEDNHYEDAENIYNYIIFRNIFDDSEIESLIYHLKGNLYQKKYNYFKDNKSLIQLKKFLIKAVRNYYKAEKIYKRDKTYSNLVVTFIELFKIEKNQGKENNKYLIKAQSLLKNVKKDYHWYWDNSRILYYLDNGEDNKKKVKQLLNKVVNHINKKEDKITFLEHLNKEINELNGEGFPGDRALIEECENKLSKFIIS